MEHVSLFLSVHAFTMVPPIYKDMCFNKDVVFGECGHIITSEQVLYLYQCAVELLCVLFLACARGECGTALRTTAQVRSRFQSSSLLKGGTVNSVLFLYLFFSP